MQSTIPPSQKPTTAPEATGGARKLVQNHSSISTEVAPRVQARALKRRNGYYVRPRTPQSPTLHIKRVQQATRKASESTSGGLHARCIKNYARTPVTELEVETFWISPAKREESTALSSWSPTFPRELGGSRSMNTCLALEFDPAVKCVTEFSQLRTLDMLPALGLAEDEFWKLFSRCSVCHNYIMAGTTPYHVCPFVYGQDSKSKVGIDIIQTTSFPMRLLDAHDAGREGGLPEDVFRAIFYTCGQCGRYMTERVSSSHHQADDSWDSDDHVDKKCLYLEECQARGHSQ